MGVRIKVVSFAVVFAFVVAFAVAFAVALALSVIVIIAKRVAISDYFLRLSLDNNSQKIVTYVSG